MCLLSSLSRSSSISVVFDFNASLNDVVPVSPAPFTIYGKIKEKSDFD